MDAFITAEDVRTAVIPGPRDGRLGYDANDVDAFLHRAEAALRVPPTGRRLRATAVDDVSFPAASTEDRGYDEVVVDEILDRVAQELSRREGRPWVRPHLVARQLGADADPRPRHLREGSIGRRAVGHLVTYFDWWGTLALGLGVVVVTAIVDPTNYVAFGCAALLLIAGAVAYRYR